MLLQLECIINPMQMVQFCCDGCRRVFEMCRGVLNLVITLLLECSCCKCFVSYVQGLFLGLVLSL